MKILLLEDDALIAEQLVQALIDQQYQVDVATDSQRGWALLESASYDLILLDAMLPKLDGISFCQQVRSQGRRIPILLLINSSDEASLYKLLDSEVGADDWVDKPLSLPDLLARIHSLLSQHNSPPVSLEWRNLKLTPSLGEVICEQQLVPLTPKEHSLLALLLRNPHRIFSPGALMEYLGAYEELTTEDTIRFHVQSLRQKLAAAGVLEDPIETVYGIGYRLRAAQTALLTQEDHPDTLTPTVATAEAAGMLKIWEQIKETVEQRVAVLEQAAILLRQDQLSEELRQQAEQEAHRLAGSLGMFGADEGSRLAQEIEPLFERGQSLSQKQKHHLAQLVTYLRQELQNLSQGQLLELPEALEDQRPRLLMVSLNAELTQQLATEAPRWGMQFQSTVDPVAARAQISEQRPEIVFLDLAAAKGCDNFDNYWMLLAELNADTPPVPVLVLTEPERLIDRVKVARLGGRGVLQQPTTATQILESVNRALQQTHPTQAQIMVVDDDPQILMALQRLLIPWGLHVLVLDNPLQFWETLESTRPDLLILDVEMPHINGIELCQVVRNDARWSGLPILFLTAHADAETMRRVFEVGADDYVCKPIVEPELITRILNRLERWRLLKSLAEVDPLTGVANRQQSTQILTEFLLWCDHCQQPFCFAVIELSHLKQINQHYGHAAGDAVLARLGELLRQTFRHEDTVGRWGGGEFVVGMAGMTKTEGIQRLVALQEALQQFEFQAEDGRLFQASFKFGVGQFPQDGTDLPSLYCAALARNLSTQN